MAEQELDQYPVIIFETEEGPLEYLEFRTVTYEDQEFAILIPSEDAHSDEPAVTICRKDIEDGEEVYVEPTEEEFNAVADLVVSEYGEGLED